MKKKNIAVVGLGYVGTALALLLAKSHKVTGCDIDEYKISSFNGNNFFSEEVDLNNLYKQNNLNFHTTSDITEACNDSNYIIIALPTDLKTVDDELDTSLITEAIRTICNINSEAVIVIKSTVPVGFTENISLKYPNKILYSPEFIREGNTMHDNLYPDRIVVGGCFTEASYFAEMLVNISKHKNNKICIVSSSEAESIKLFSNTFLAMRVAYFNELDSFAMQNNLDTKSIIDGVCSDKRIQDFYNNPSFGYGGYCLPKDSKQLQSDFHDTPQSLISSIISSNSIRKDFLSEKINLLKPKKVGIYRLTIKSLSDNYRNSAVLEIMYKLRADGLDVSIYEPYINELEYNNFTVNNNLEEFKKSSDIIIANRISDELNDVKDKIFTRDIFNRD